jgi:predicted NAD/FAD-dependent oxidoreductase
MFVFPEPVRHNADIIQDQGLIGWAARDNAKPGRSGPERWVVQARPQWSVAHLEDASEIIAPHLLEALAAACRLASRSNCPVDSSLALWPLGRDRSGLPLECRTQPRCLR